MPKGVRLTEEQTTKIRSMTVQRYTQVEISEALGISVNTVSRIQKKYGLLASNRYNGGMISQAEEREAPKITSKPEDQPKKPMNDCSVVAAERIITFTGKNTGYLYGLETRMDKVRITTNNSKDIVIDVNDLVSFGNELLDMADKIIALSRIPW